MKKIFKGLAVGMLGLSMLVGCTTQAPGTADKGATDGKKENITVGLAVSTQSNPFFVTLKEGAEKAAKENNMKLVTVDAQDDPAKQISGIEDLIQQQVDVLLVNPTDSAAIASAIKSANRANIPVITVDRSAEGGEVVSHVASDNVAGGKMAAEYLLEKIGKQGNVVELEGIPGASAARERGKGFHEIMDKESGVKVVAKQPADFDRAKGMSVMENILQGNKDIKGVFAHNDEMALGALKAIQSAGLKDVVVVGFDATDDAVAAVKQGSMSATVAQKPDLIGKQAIEVAKKVAAGEKVEKNVPVTLELIKQ
ncbi:ribose ABC transporter substrate-binding protein RbsB [Aneurinibacillus migulanus]|uniref:D-ribose transporter subunit RbsB n=1 Tax=Aneurinibacillus migulanus TaxID=47500 RepID=A0A0D1WK68_ANEMI|nr:ribose ABC transporter substrate-binding protein RbsB [Aneurinibacillus migulanus]KIV59020.1 D-ribose transporter subunit RbsB [Aneurinibacillus migulanus]KON99275.1 D-ribose transporter subunit RbsB [Aneurinibacillus migulanus]MED0893289.1 ribose ABC transporter substrate-binding protein RbsB [Aneurinibacillus migulanus]MED1615406.1 ribose ABC transporter substrate-binding protein RbsB [Aneurinibacillus migulanus]SDI57539.1 ribose-binding protein [Aneurinibacillus migulanus]